MTSYRIAMIPRIKSLTKMFSSMLYIWPHLSFSNLFKVLFIHCKPIYCTKKPVFVFYNFFSKKRFLKTDQPYCWDFFFLKFTGQLSSLFNENWKISFIPIQKYVGCKVFPSWKVNDAIYPGRLRYLLIYIPWTCLEGEILKKKLNSPETYVARNFQLTIFYFDIMCICKKYSNGFSYAVFKTKINKKKIWYCCEIIDFHKKEFLRSVFTSD